VISVVALYYPHHMEWKPKPNCWGGRAAVACGRGRHRAAFWRAQGFPNLVRAREVRAANRARVKEAAELARRQALLAGNIENLRPWRST
jgi:hypothetical protein